MEIKDKYVQPAVRIGEFCVERGDLSKEQVERVIGFASDQERRFCSAAYGLGLLTESRCLEILKHFHGGTVVELESWKANTAALSRLSESVARECRALPLHVFRSTLVVAMADALDSALIETLRAHTGLTIRSQFALSALIDEKLDLAYRTTSAQPVQPVKPMPIPIGLGSLNATNVAEYATLTSPKVIALLDAENGSLDTYRMAIDAGQFKLETFDEGSKLLRFLDRSAVDLVIVGTTRFGLNALEVCRRIKTETKTQDLPLILVTRLIKEREWRQHPRARLADAFFEKPFDASALSQEIRSRIEFMPRWIDVSLSDESMDSTLSGSDRSSSRSGDIDTLDQVGAPSEPAACLQFGRTLEQQGSIYQALEWFEKAVALDPSLFSSRRELAEFYERHGYATLALDAWQNALMVDCTPAEAEVSRKAVRRLKR